MTEYEEKAIREAEKLLRELECEKEIRECLEHMRAEIRNTISGVGVLNFPYCCGYTILFGTAEAEDL